MRKILANLGVFLTVLNVITYKLYKVQFRNDIFFDAVDTGRKLNVHKTFRRRPGRLLNVLCTLNLRPVSTGELLNITTKGSKTFSKIPFVFHVTRLINCIVGYKPTKQNM